MKTLTIFNAMIRARNEMERDLVNRADDAFLIPVGHTRAAFGCMVDKDHYALQYQHHRRQYERFEEYIRNILHNDPTLNELRRLMQSPYNVA